MIAWRGTERNYVVPVRPGRMWCLLRGVPRAFALSAVVPRISDFCFRLPVDLISLAVA